MQKDETHTQADNSQTQTAKRVRVLSVPLVILIGITFICGLYEKGLNTGLPLYYDKLGYSTTIGGTLVAIFTLSSTITRLIGGKATDRFNHLLMIMISMVLLLVGVVLPAVWDAFPVVVAARVFRGSGFALSANVITVLMQSLVPKGHLGESAGLKGAGASLSVMFGAAIATFLLDNYNFQGFFIFYIALIVLGIAGVILLPHTKAFKRMVQAENEAQQSNAAAPAAAADAAATEATSAAAATTADAANAAPKNDANTSDAATATDTPPAKKPSRIKRAILSFYLPDAMPYLGVSFAHRIMRGLCVSFILVYCHYSGIGSGPMFFFVAGIATLVFRLFGGKFYDHANDWWLFPMVFIYVVGFAAMALWPCDVTFYIMAVCYGTSIGTASPFLKTLAAKSVSKEHWGLAAGELFFAGDIGLSAGAFFAGIAMDIGGKELFPFVGLVYGLIASVITFAVLDRSHKH